MEEGGLDANAEDLGNMVESSVGNGMAEEEEVTGDNGETERATTTDPYGENIGGVKVEVLSDVDKDEGKDKDKMDCIIRVCKGKDTVDCITSVYNTVDCKASICKGKDKVDCITSVCKGKDILYCKTRVSKGKDTVYVRVRI